MKLNIIWNDKKFFALVILALLFIVSGIISPLLITNLKKNWDDILNQRIYSDELLIKRTFEDKINFLLGFQKAISEKIQNSVKHQNQSLPYEDLSALNTNNLSIEIFESGGDRIFWRNEQIIRKLNLLEQLPHVGQAVFYQSNLHIYLTLFDTLQINDQTYSFFCGLPVESNYKLSGSSEIFNMSDSLSQLLGTSVKINYAPEAPLSRDGRIHSFSLLNNFNNKICVINYEKPALDNSILALENILIAAQSIMILFFYTVLSWILYNKIRTSKRRAVKFLSFLIFISVLRLILFLAGFPSSFLNNELTSASNFSSTFAFGMVRSPLELAITSVLGFIVVIAGFRSFIRYYDEKDKRNESRIKFVFISLTGFFFILLTIRGLGASLRSVVFDSSIRYFKEFILIPDAPTFLMDFSILVVGFSAILFCLTILLFIFIFAPSKNNKVSYLLFLGLFFSLQILGGIFDIFQKQPQGTPLIRILFITVLFALTFLLVFRNYRSIIKYLYIAFGASIATVSLLTYYNSEIERESLKTTAQELTRSDENIFRFMVFQTLAAIQNNDEVKDALLINKSPNSLAYIEWTKSLLYRETIPAFIIFYDKHGRSIGGFSTSNSNEKLNYAPDTEKKYDVPDVSIITDAFGNEINIVGYAAMKNEEDILGYVGVGVIYDVSYFSFTKVPSFLFAERSGISSAVNIERLKIFYFHDGILEKYFGNAQLTEDEVNRITSTKFTRYNEAWMKLKIAGENYLFYLLNTEINGSKILAVAKEEKNFSWNLSDFFKVFFVHTVIILAFSLIVALWNYRKLRIFLNSYRTKLASAFLIVSVIPLFIIAVYFKSITEVKNTELISIHLAELADRVKNYLTVYSNNSSVQPEIIYEKAVEDLGINFSLYDNKHIIYSSTKDFYSAGLLTDVIPFEPWYNLFRQGLMSSVEKDRIKNQDYYSVYLKFGNESQAKVIEVKSQFNKISLPLSDIEVDIFMFGVYSLALIMLIIFSTILAEQISAPIRKLTNATRSIGSGDLNVEVAGNYSGEIAELTGGFNKMVKQLRKSQVEMAQLEREAAWKEMAKQVAHEIKNPLTPMKLSVQQLIAAYRDKSPKFDSIFEKVTSTIIAQVEALKNIASEFSNFARMPKLNIERINLITSIKEAINLFSNEKLDIKLESGISEIYINADHDHLNRTLINLIRNSIQAKAKKLLVVVSTEKKYCLIRVIDDGTGIKSENFEKIFEENYTTKSEGMGLGLSMAKRFIESINGKIVVERSSAEGTIFLLTLPITE